MLYCRASRPRLVSTRSSAACITSTGKVAGAGKPPAKEITSDYLDGKVSWGTAKTVGAAEGYIRFIQDSAERKNPAVGDDIRAKMASVVNSIADGTLRLPQN